MRPNAKSVSLNELLPWLKVQEFAVPAKIKTVSEEKVPAKPGVYIMISDRTGYVYPWSGKKGKSRVFYIGRSRNLRNRLEEHRKYCAEVEDFPKFDYYYPRYEYAAFHGCNVSWKACRSEHAARDLEHDLLVDFAKYYGAKPVANGQSAWE